MGSDSGNDDVAGTVLWGLIGLVVAGGGGSFLFWLAGQLSAVLTGHGWPDTSVHKDLIPILKAWKDSPGHPGLAWSRVADAVIGPAWLVFVLFLVMVVPCGFLAYVVVRFALNFRRRRGFRVFRLGFASGWEIRRLLGARAVVKRARLTRPVLARQRRVDPLEVGFFLGRDTRSQNNLYSSVEDAMLIIAPPRGGKDAHFCTPFTIDAPGACFVASTGVEAFTTTFEKRAQVGKVYVFDPNRLTRWPQRFRWSPVGGCEDPDQADDHAKLFVSWSGYLPGADGSHAVATAAIVILRCYFHAAALHGRTIRDVVRWATEPTNPEPLELLRRAEQANVAAVGWASELATQMDTGAGQRSARWAVVRQSLAVFFDTGVQDECCPEPGEVLDLKEFVSGRNTLYLLGRERGTNPVIPLVTIILQNMLSEMRTLALQTPQGRLDPPVSIEINEAAWIAPMASLPRFMGLMGRYSVGVHVYLRSLAQAEDKWGKDGAAAMWDAAAVRVIAGGGGNIDDLEDVSKLLGDIYLPNGKSLGRRILTADEIRTMPFGHAVVVARDARPVEVKLTPWWKRKDGTEIAAAKARVEAKILQYAAAATRDNRIQQYIQSAVSNTQARGL